MVTSGSPGRRGRAGPEQRAEQGLVRPLDAGVKLPDHARVIIVASEAAE